MSSIQIDQIKFKEILKKINNVAKNIDNMAPVWQEWEKFFLGKVVPGIFDTKGSTLGEQWQSYSPAYKKWKSKNHPGKPMLVLKGVLKEAATGGKGYRSRVVKKNLIMEIVGVDHALAQHEGNPGQNLPARRYWTNSKGQIPARAITMLLRIMTKHARGNFK